MSKRDFQPGFTDISALGTNGAMQAMEDQDYIFGPFYLNTRERILSCDGKAVPMTLKAFNILFVLVQNCGHIVAKSALMKEVWPNAFVEEANLTQHIYLLRKVLGVKADGRQYIETIPRRGYRFTPATSESIPGSDDTGISTRAAGKSPETTIISLAIVPFALAGVESDVEVLGNQITESLASILSGLPQLRIMSRNIVFTVQK